MRARTSCLPKSGGELKAHASDAESESDETERIA